MALFSPKQKVEILKHHAELFQPSFLELNSLGKNEKVKLDVTPARGISEGRQSRVSVLEYQVGDTKNRVLWKRMGSNKNLSLEEATLLGARLLPYRKSLIEHGWNVPIFFHTQVVELSKEAQIFSYEQFIPGGDGDFMVSDPEEPNFRKWHLIRTVIETLSRYPLNKLKKVKLENTELTLLPHGLDLKLANVVLDKDGVLYFVDLFGPKEIGPNSSWLTYSKKLDSLQEEKLLAVCATREGAILRFYRLLEKQWLNTSTVTKTELRTGIFELLDSLDMPKKEVDFIKKEIRDEFPWLDAIYQESRV